MQGVRRGSSGLSVGLDITRQKPDIEEVILQRSTGYKLNRTQYCRPALF